MTKGWCHPGLTRVCLVLGINIMFSYSSTPLPEVTFLVKEEDLPSHEDLRAHLMSSVGANHFWGCLRKDFALRGQQHAMILTV